jgi:hypothetical protein
VEEILAETCSNTLSDGRSDVLSESGGGGGGGDENYGDVEPKTARKIKETVHHLFSDSESGSAKQQDSNDKNEIYSATVSAT